METQILETVLTDMLEEQKMTNQLIHELTDRAKELEEKVAGFSQKLDQVQIVAPPIDPAPIQKVVTRGLMDVARMVEKQPKNVIRQVRLLLFPETNTDHYYKIIFGRLIPWGGLFVLAVFLIALARDYLERYSAIQERRYYYEVYQDAWNRLDSSSDRAGRQKMKEIMQRAVNGHTPE